MFYQEKNIWQLKGGQIIKIIFYTLGVNFNKSPHCGIKEWHEFPKYVMFCMSEDFCMTRVDVFKGQLDKCLLAVPDELQITGYTVQEAESNSLLDIPDSKVHGANRGPTWVLLNPDGPHVGPMNLAIRDGLSCPYQE